MPKDALWSAIAETLHAEVAAGLYPPGARLPTEAQLSARFGVNRHTVRRGLQALAGDGLVQPRRGAGVFVTARPTDYPISRRVRFQQNILASGRTPSRRFLRLETRPASLDEAEPLGLAPGSAVHLVEGLSMADDLPLALFRSVFPADRLQGFLPALAECGSITAALAAVGVADYTRAATRVTAMLADALLALHLRLPTGAPILQSVTLNRDPAGRPLEFGQTWFAGDRVALTVALD